jgi:hypothetical protein
VNDRWWYAVVMSSGPSSSGIRVFPSRFVERVAGLLSGDTPVGFYPSTRGELVHPPHNAAAIRQAAVGAVVRAWYDRSSANVFAILAIDSERIRRGLVRLERARRLPGISMILDEPTTRDLNQQIEYADARAVLSVDLVSSPDSVGARVLRSL